MFYKIIFYMTETIYFVYFICKIITKLDSFFIEKIKFFHLGNPYCCF